MSPSNTLLNTESLKILAISSSYPRHDDDNEVPWLRESHAQIKARGHQVTVLAPSYRGLSDHVIDGIDVKRFRYAPSYLERLTHDRRTVSSRNHPMVKLMAVPYFLSGRRTAARLAKQEKYDIIHVHWPFPHEPIANAAAKACGAAVVIVCHGSEFTLVDRKPWIRPILRRSLRRADYVIANCNDTAAKIEELSGVTAKVLPYGTIVNPKPVEIPFNSVPRVLFTGSLTHRKGAEYLLKAVPQILEKHPAEFVFAGDGDQRSKLEAVRQQLEIEANVKFLGFVSEERLNEEYARCDVWVNPSVVDERGNTEGLGIGSIMAYAHRKPVVASAVGVMPDTVRHGETGYLIPEKDEIALAEAIIELLDDPEKARTMGESGLKFAQEKFDWNIITDRLEHIYFDLLAARNRSEDFSLAN